ncbi:MAG TPA: GTP-binding protein, partial [Clostridia bacterium]
MENNREVLKIVVVGHVDHGKSTVIGRLLYDTKSVPEGKIERVKKTCREKGKPFEYAYLLDAFEEEQKQGITIDTTQLQFFTEKRDYVIIDAPGHKEFLKNMISGAANAEAALLIIDAYEGVQEQSKRHGYILSLLGIQKVYVIVNKMDLIDYSEEKFNAIKHEMNEFLNNLHVYPMKYIPISAFYGENMTSKSDKMPWYKDEPVLSAIDLIEKDKGLSDKPLRFPIQDVYKFDKHRRIIAGRIESGSLNVGDEIFISPGNKVTKVKTIEYWQEKDNKDTVSAGMSVGITVEDEFFNKRGEVITHKENAPLVSDIFKANLFWMGKNPLAKGKKYKLKLVTQEVECEVVTVNKVIDATTLETIENADSVKTNDVAEVTIRTKEE